MAAQQRKSRRKDIQSEEIVHSDHESEGDTEASGLETLTGARTVATVQEMLQMMTLRDERNDRRHKAEQEVRARDQEVRVKEQEARIRREDLDREERAEIRREAREEREQVLKVAQADLHAKLASDAEDKLATQERLTMEHKERIAREDRFRAEDADRAREARRNKIASSIPPFGKLRHPQDLVEFLDQFEIHMRQYRVDHDQWHTLLLPLLDDQTSTAMMRLDQETKLDFSRLSSALAKANGITPAAHGMTGHGMRGSQG